MKCVAWCAALVLSAIASAAAQSPLDRRVTIHVRDVSLREALDRVAVLGAIRLSYSGDNLPLDRRVTVDRDTTRIIDVLDDLLRAYPVAPIAVGADHVVLSPREASVADTTTRSIAVLDRVVVTGSVIDAPERALPIALDVVRGRDIERRQERELSEVLSGSVPGVWLWEQSPTSLMARYGSIRGASSFGLSFPKIYVDGIEVANPLLLTHISPELVERVEVIRGPQGGVLYGSDAISGVVNIVSRHEGVDPDGNRALLRTAAGYADSRYTATGVAVQDHALTLRAGSNLRSFGVTVGGSSSGEYIPQAYSREVRAVGQVRLIGAHSKLTANARFLGKDAGVPESPLLATFRPDSLESDLDPQQLRLFAAGSTLTIVPAGRWTYTVTAGLDGYTLENAANDHTPVPSIADTELRNASGSAARGTLRANALTTLGKPEDVAATLTLGAERSDLWDRTLRERLDDESSSGSTEGFENSRSNSSGILAHGVLALRDATFITGGLRGERIVQPNGLTQYALLPLAGVALLQEFTRGTVKWRASYGRGIRASHSPNRVTHEAKLQLDNPNLAPEEQSGVELGADIRVGRFFGLQITGFDQLVSGLVQQVPVQRPDGSRGPGSAEDLWFQLQNVGQISNRGWESHASLALGPLGLDGTATFVDSRVRQTLINYSGELRPGDRMLAVPARTLSGTASYAGPRGFHVSTTISRASDWINYDRLAIAKALIDRSVDFYEVPGNKLREFWAKYPGATRLRSSLSIDAWRGMVVSVTGENLLGYQRGEPDTITIVPGRTVTVGVRARF